MSSDLARTGVHVFVMAGGTGTRLHPLTAGLCKPALPFGGDHCVVDFVLSNLFNSGLAQVDLLVQYAPDALLGHVRQAWCKSGAPRGDEFVRIVRPAAGSPWRGTADAVFQNLHRVSPGADTVLVFGADHVYRMDVAALLDFHRGQHADATVAALPVPVAQAAGFGIVDVDANGLVNAFEEKPRLPPTMPGSPGHALASMGNYAFNAAVLKRELAAAQARGEHDFGQHVLPRLLHNHRVMAYDFAANRVPGLAASEQPGYWRDVGTIDAYFEAHLDTLGPAPVFQLRNAAWPLRLVENVAAPAGGQVSAGARVAASNVAASAVVHEGAVVEQSVVGRNVRVRAGARLSRAVVLERSVVGAGARLANVIVDRDNTIPAGETIGFNRVHDARRFPVSAGGVVVVPRGYFSASHSARSVLDSVPPRTLSLHCG